MFDDQFGEDPMMVGMQPMGAAPEPKPTESGDSSVDSMMADVLAAEPTSATMDSEMSSFGEEVPSFEEPVAPAVESPEPAPAPVPEPVSEPVAPAPEPVAPAPAPTPTPAPIPAPAPTQSITPVQNTAAGAEQPKKKSSAVLIVILIVLAIAAIVATGFVAYNIGKNDGAKARDKADSSNSGDVEKNSDGDSEEGENKDKDEDEEKEAIKQRNAKREEDISRFLKAMADYQANNNGRTPFQVEEESLFTARYIDRKCDIDSANKKMLVAGTCGEDFTDPDGTQYEWAVDDVVLTETDSTRTVTGDNVDHKIYVYQAARCGSVDGEANYYAGARSVALLYIGEGGTTICHDNQ